MIESFFKNNFKNQNIIFIFAILIFLFLIVKMQDIAVMFFASFVIACSLNPLVDKLTAKNFSRNAAAGIVLGGTILLILMFFIPLILLAGHEIKEFAINFPQFIDSIKEFTLNSPFLNKSQFAKIDIGETISSVSGFTAQFFNQVVDLGKNLGSAFIYLLASAIIIYYFMADKSALKEAYKSMFPKHLRVKAEEVLDIISQKVGGYIIGQLAAIASVGIIMTIGLLLLKVEYAVLLGLITAILDIIPIVGPGIALIICFIAAYKSGPLVLVLVAVVFAITQLAENNFVKPYVFGKLLNLHPILIYLFLFITAKYVGIIGVIFAPAIAATVSVLIEELYIKNMEE